MAGERVLSGEDCVIGATRADGVPPPTLKSCLDGMAGRTADVIAALSGCNREERKAIIDLAEIFLDRPDGWRKD